MRILDSLARLAGHSSSALRLPVLLVLGYVLAFVAGDVADSGVYLLVASSLLAVGLYGATFGIDLQSAKQDARLIVSAVTVGVVVKAMLIGGLTSLLMRDPIYLVLGFAIAQIDPLSVASIMRRSKMSQRAKAILACWSSFDDPVTVLLTFYVAPIIGTTLWDDGSALQDVQGLFSWSGYSWQLMLNFGMAITAFAIWKLIRPPKAFAPLFFALLVYVLLGSVLTIAVWLFLMMGLAIVGLFLRPDIERVVSRGVSTAFAMSAVMLGMVAAGGINLVGGICLGVAAYCAQVVVGLVLTKGLPRSDRLHLALAQQNGITAIILALLLETMHDGVVAIMAPAIVCVNVLHMVVNRFLLAEIERDVEVAVQ